MNEPHAKVPFPDRQSLLPGRNSRPLSKRLQASVEACFRGLDYQGPLVFEDGPGTHTRFRTRKEGNTLIGEIVVGADIYPGTEVTNPNAMLDVLPAAAHEVTHFQRWENDRQIDEEHLLHLDEAMTSLQAACTFKPLNRYQIEQLVSDALSRLVLLRESLTKEQANGDAS